MRRAFDAGDSQALVENMKERERGRARTTAKV
jgi:hypothetical protein